MSDNTNGIAADQLRSYVERIGRLEEEKASLASDIREVYAEAKGGGFDTKALRKVIALRKLNEAERAEQQAILDLYLGALGMLADTPLGRSAVSREFAETKMSIKVAGKRGRSLKDRLGDRLDEVFGAENVQRDVRL